MTTATPVNNTRKLTVTALLSALAFILMALDFSVPFVPSFIKMDLSELPALIAAFSFGPLSGVTVCLLKNCIHLTITSTNGIGEVSNFILGAAFVLPAGLIYKRNHTRKGAILGSLIGAVTMGLISVPSNFFVVYPAYYTFYHMTEELVLGAYQLIVPSVKTIFQCLIMFNLPFTFIKGLFSVIITVVIYKFISPLLKGKAKA